jgi:hypothetical protein
MPEGMERTMSMFYITADRLASISEWRRGLRECRNLITFGQLEPRKSDVRVDTTKWFWNGELCCNPWMQRY